MGRKGFSCLLSYEVNERFLLCLGFGFLFDFFLVGFLFVVVFFGFWIFLLLFFNVFTCQNAEFTPVEDLMLTKPAGFISSGFVI